VVVAQPVVATAWLELLLVHSTVQPQVVVVVVAQEAQSALVATVVQAHSTVQVVVVEPASMATVQVLAAMEQVVSVSYSADSNLSLWGKRYLASELGWPSYVCQMLDNTLEAEGILSRNSRLSVKSQNDPSAAS
jgi:hypothetical protein